MAKGVVERLLTRKRKLEAALERLDNGSYGIYCQCEMLVEPEQPGTLKLMHADLCSLGFNGSYDRVAPSLFNFKGGSKFDATQHSAPLTECWSKGYLTLLR